MDLVVIVQREQQNTASVFSEDGKSSGDGLPHWHQKTDDFNNPKRPSSQRAKARFAERLIRGCGNVPGSRVGAMLFLPPKSPFGWFFDLSGNACLGWVFLHVQGN